MVNKWWTWDFICCTNISWASAVCQALSWTLRNSSEQTKVSVLVRLLLMSKPVLLTLMLQVEFVGFYSVG